MKRDAGFTLVEVMVSMLIGTIGLLGTIAVQQAITSASKNANDAAIAMRLAQQKIDEFASKNTDSPAADAQPGLGLSTMATVAGSVVWYPQNFPEYVNSAGQILRDLNSYPRQPVNAAEIAQYRWFRQWSVVDTGVGLPYVISVIVTYTNDAGAPKTIRLDMERRKSWGKGSGS